MSKSKRKKTDRHRQPRGPEALRKKEKTSRKQGSNECFPQQLPQFPLVHRAKPEVINGRMYMATARMHLDSGEVAEFDLLATLHAIATGELTGVCADIMAALAFTYIQQAPIPLANRDLITTPTALVDSFRRLVADGFMGCDHHGGYLTAGPLPAVV
ncbi:hypothetical protein AB0E67_35080 [Streptomyces sp. NPDC032161]|uniref:hypothetical protein n=1 Tax=unclassified Streptomyces TaxID=2593676 RepID=UPI0033D0010D